MKTFTKAQRIMAECPREALGDAIGIAAMALLIFIGFTVPAFI